MSNELTTLVESQRNQFESVVAIKGIEFDREAQFALQILSSNEYLAKTAIGNKNSLCAAINNVAAIGISLNPASKLAYLVPRKNAVCLDISYIGLMHIAQQTGAIKWGQAVIVRANDQFELQGIDSPPMHKFNPFGVDRGDVIGCYVVVKTDEGDYLTHSMPISKINDIRDRSEAWKSHLKNKTSCPWVTDTEEMIKKTVVKQASKYWPRRDRLDSAVHYLNTESGQGIELDVTPKMSDEEFKKFETRIKGTVHHDDAKREWKAATSACSAIGDLASAAAFKEITIAHRTRIDEAIAAEVQPIKGD